MPVAEARTQSLRGREGTQSGRGGTFNEEKPPHVHHLRDRLFGLRAAR